MNKRKEDLFLGYEKLREECKSTIQLLEILLEKNYKAVEQINKYDLKRFQNNATIYRETLKQQNEVHEKVSFLNIELESLLDIDLPALQATSIYNESMASKLSEIDSTPIHSTSNPFLSSTMPSTYDANYTEKFLPQMELVESKTITDEYKTENNLNTSFSDENKIIDQHNIPLRDEYTSIQEDMNKQVGEKSVPEEKINLSNENMKKDEEEENKIVTEEKNPKNMRINKENENKTAPEEKRYNLKNLPLVPPDYDFDSEESTNEIEDESAPISLDYDLNNGESVCSKRMNEMEKETESINEKMRNDTFRSREDKYVENLPKIKIPDLSFSRRGDSSSEYLSASSHENTEESVKVQKAKKSSKLASNIKVIEIPEATMPNKLDYCVVSSFENPSEFFINVANEDTELLDSLPYQLREYCENSPSFQSKTHAKQMIDKYCIAFSDEFKNYYRAIIIDWFDSEDYSPNDDVKVQFIDYGDYLDTTYKSLFPLPDSLSKLPRMAIQCHLAFLFPIGSTLKRKIPIWPENAMKIFKKIMNSMNNYYQIVFLEKTKPSLTIDLIQHTEIKANISLCDKMISAEAGVQLIYQKSVSNELIKNQISTAQGIYGVDGSMTSEQVMEKFWDNMDETEEPTSVEQAVTNYEAKDNERICRFTRSDNTCFKGVNCKLDHMQIRNDGITTDQQCSYTRSLQGMPKPRIGEEINIFVTSFCAVDQFYAQVRDYFPEGKALNKLNILINSKLLLKQLKDFTVLPALGEIVLAKHWDNHWYRAMVLNIDSSFDTPQVIVKVLFVDYGERMDILLRNVKHITNNLLHLPFQAVKCVISNIVPNNHVMTPAEREYVEKEYSYKDFSAKVVYVGEAIWAVQLFQNEQDIGKKMVIDGYARHGAKHYPDPKNSLLVD